MAVVNYRTAMAQAFEELEAEGHCDRFKAKIARYESLRRTPTIARAGAAKTAVKKPAAKKPAVKKRAKV